MRNLLRTIVLSSVALCATAALADPRARVNLPFDFTVRGQSFPAGSYDVITHDNEHFITLANVTNFAKRITLISWPSDPSRSPAVLSFDVSAGRYSLRTIHMGVRITGDLDARDRKASKPALAERPGPQEATRDKAESGSLHPLP
jgi:hypothetical protein